MLNLCHAFLTLLSPFQAKYGQPLIISWVNNTTRRAFSLVSMRLWLNSSRFLAQWLFTTERFVHSRISIRETCLSLMAERQVWKTPAASHCVFPVLTDGTELFHRAEALWGWRGGGCSTLARFFFTVLYPLLSWFSINQAVWHTFPTCQTKFSFGTFWFTG